jgi:hypothetical protein
MNPSKMTLNQNTLLEQQWKYFFAWDTFFLCR